MVDKHLVIDAETGEEELIELAPAAEAAHEAAQATAHREHERREAARARRSAAVSVLRAAAQRDPTIRALLDYLGLDPDGSD